MSTTDRKTKPFEAGADIDYSPAVTQPGHLRLGRQLLLARPLKAHAQLPYVREMPNPMRRINCSWHLVRTSPGVGVIVEQRRE
jgi:hypothetical protein